MSWKSIELQVALPRTQDAGKLQDQMLKQNQHFQESLAQSQSKQEELKRKRVQEMETVNEAKFEEDDYTNNSSEIEQSDETNKGNKTVDHPYLGTNFDFTG
ncbi:hypothetical protein ACFSTA_06165 [Ornithinibacillus salinisoli]|uniref:RNA polymerase subunit sigma n=1 Tax=Ornithinibacillus salinisoli TaxID=1848459 RepID=A0ABW4VY78_9BACI